MRISDCSADVCSSDLVRLREHFFDRGEVILALRPVAIIFRHGLPAFPRIVEPLGEAFVLLLLRDVNEQLDGVVSAAGQLRLELVDLVIALAPLGFARIALDALDEDTAVDRKSTRMKSVPNALLVLRLL